MFCASFNSAFPSFVVLYSSVVAPVLPLSSGFGGGDAAAALRPRSVPADLCCVTKQKAVSRKPREEVLSGLAPRASDAAPWRGEPGRAGGSARGRGHPLLMVTLTASRSSF